MQKTFVLNTDILLNYPDAVYGFEDNNVVITAQTLEELDRINHDHTEQAMKARAFFRNILKPLRDDAVLSGTTLADGVPINDGMGTFFVCTDNSGVSSETFSVEDFRLPSSWSTKYNDNALLVFVKENRGILVTDDGILLAKAATVGVDAQEYRNAQFELDDGYTGMGEMALPREAIDSLMDKGCISLESYLSEDYKADFVNNQYFIIHDIDNPSHTVLGRYCTGKMHRLHTFDKKRCRVTPKNVTQQFAIDALLDPDIPFVILEGPAGTAKTFLSVSCGMQKISDETYEQMIVTRNNVEFDRSIGALPGDEMEKVAPLVRGFMDNLRAYLKIQGTATEDIALTIDDYIETQIIDIESMGFMRGRSIPDAYLILEECQNATVEQVKSIVTRAAENCKIVLTGDSSQIDNASLTAKTCGIAAARYIMKGSPLCVQLKFSEEECVRSALAKEAAKRFEDTRL